MIDEDRKRLQTRVGQRIFHKREELGLSQQSLAEALGCSVTRVSSLERGQVPLTLDALHDLATALGTSFVYLGALPERRGRPRANGGGE